MATFGLPWSSGRRARRPLVSPGRRAGVRGDCWSVFCGRRTSLLVVPAWCPCPCHPTSLMSFTTSRTSSSIHMSSSPPAHHPQYVTWSPRVHPPYVWVQLEIACETPVFSVLHSSYFSPAPMNSLLWGIPSTSPDIVALLCASWSLGLLQLHIQLLLVSLLVVEVLAFVVWRMLVFGQGVGGLY